MTTVEQIETKTQFGLPIDESFGKRASEESIQKAAKALIANNFSVEVVDTPADASAYVVSILPKGESIYTVASETVRLSGLDEAINRSGQYNAIRPQLEKLDYATQRTEMRRLGAAPDVAVGSVHAVTEDGKVVVASATGSQLGPYAGAAGKVIWVVGSQKIVPDIATAMKRVQFYSYPKEDIRMRATYGMPSALRKILTVSGDWAGRTTIVIIREPIGF